MKVEVHILAFNEEEILPYTIRHYRTFASRVIVHDAHSPDRTAEVSRAAGAEVESWGLGGVVSDTEYCALKNSCWKGTDADWVIVCDADEMIYFPSIEVLGLGKSEAINTLAVYSGMGAAVIKPHGFEMFSATYPTTAGQIYEEVNMGARDDQWYSKPLLFNPRLVAESGFGVGSHEARMVLKDGRALMVDRHWLKADPAAYLLHFHQIGPIERIGARYDAVCSRMSAENRARGWGNLKPGVVHAQEKRDLIIPRLERVIP